MTLNTDMVLKLFQDELSNLQNRITHEKDKEAFKTITIEIKIINDLITCIFKYKMLQQLKIEKELKK